MKITKVCVNKEGGSYFEEMHIPLMDKGDIGWLSENFPVKNIIFRKNDASYDYDWHCAPQKQFIILLDGEIEIECSDGEKRQFVGGDILLVEDTTGKGHRTRVTNNQPRKSVFVTLE